MCFTAIKNHHWDILKTYPPKIAEYGKCTMQQVITKSCNHLPGQGIEHGSHQKPQCLASRDRPLHPLEVTARLAFVIATPLLFITAPAPCGSLLSVAEYFLLSNLRKGNQSVCTLCAWLPLLHNRWLWESGVNSFS